jgi:hypothetical protein
VSGVQRWRLADGWGEPAIEHEDVGGDYVDFADYTAALAAKDAEIERMREALRHCEWGGIFSGDCPLCGGDEPTHEYDCDMPELLGHRADGGEPDAV